MTRLLIATLCLFTTVDIHAQEEPNRKIKFSLSGGIARSTFVYGKHSIDFNFPTAELRLGMGLSKVMLRNFEIKSGLSIGVKLKRKPDPNPNRDPAQIYAGLDGVVSGLNHWFYEIPLLFQYNFNKEIMGQPNFFGIRTGVNYRLFWDREANVQGFDFFQNLSEFGVIIGANLNISKRINLGIDYCMGITKIFGAAIFTGDPLANPPVAPTLLYDFYARNNFIQLKMEYRLKK